MPKDYDYEFIELCETEFSEQSKGVKKILRTFILSRQNRRFTFSCFSVTLKRSSFAMMLFKRVKLLFFFLNILKRLLI